jgi:two-component system sensor histidine kinase UhpB
MSMPILQRLLIGNTVVILIGAIGGTFLTRYFALIGNLDLIFVFSFFGIAATVLVNYWIIKTILQPLHELSSKLGQVKEGQSTIGETALMRSDPDIHQLVLAIDSMLKRLDQRTQELKALSERAINAQEEERMRIARGLHDETSQAISMLIIHLEQIDNCLPSENPNLQNHLASARQLAANLYEEFRKIIWNLRPSILDDLGLVPAIRWYAQNLLSSKGIKIKFATPSDQIRLSPAVETMLFRVAQEAINNIQKHANAQNLTISLSANENHAWMQIQDDGQGFDVERTSEEALSRKHLGLLGIQERLSLVGGEATISSTLGQGTSIQICVPFLEKYSIGPPSIET